MELLIRPETPADWYASELVTQRAFWNKHHPGCDEHYLVHMLRGDPAYIPELTRVAEMDGRVIGLIMYSRATLRLPDGEEVGILTFGPLCVDPDFQQQGIGGKLLETTLAAAASLGYRGVVIFGEPDYYPRHGFSTCDRWSISTADGRNYNAFMGRELAPNGLCYPGARFFEASVFSDLPASEVDAYNRLFPYMEKKRLPGQWPD